MPSIAKVGPWQLGSTIGTGSYGVVREAWHADTDKRAAVKVIDVMKLKTPKERRSLVREIEIHRKMNHPNITKIYDVYETKEQVFVVMELLEGGDLFQYVISRGKLTEEDAQRFFTQICLALDYCHRNGVAHRDIKLENFLVDKRGTVAKLTDFGLSSYFNMDPLMTFCGSPFYVAPEVAMAQPYDGFFADMWSLGITLFAMVTGRLPFVDDRGRLILDKALRGIERFPRELSIEVATVVNMLVQPLPENRASFQELFSQPWMCQRLNNPSTNVLSRSGSSEHANVTRARSASDTNTVSHFVASPRRMSGPDNSTVTMISTDELAQEPDSPVSSDSATGESPPSYGKKKKGTIGEWIKKKFIPHRKLEPVAA